MLNKIKNKRIIIALLILGIGIGFATLTQTLDLFGTANLKGNTWDIHWEDAILDDSSAGKQAPVISNDQLSVTYTVDLDFPGDSYTFYVDAVNDGTIDAMIKTFSNTIVNGETSTLPSYIKYTVTYSDGTALAAKQLLPSDSSITYRVKVEFDEEAVTKQTLPTSNSSITFRFSVEYEQADNTAVNMNMKSRNCSSNKNVEVPEGTVCKRASKLKYEVCTSGNCMRSGYNTNEWIIYGTCGTQGEEPVAGDAFDCDVDNSGTFDADERFYYISDSGSNEGYATLIYYKNVGISTYYYENSSYNNYSGPVTLLNKLPSTSEWSNTGLNTSVTRQILNQIGQATCDNGNYTLPEFTYTDRAARLLTTQEVESACGITIGSYRAGELDTCQYLLENTTYSTGSGTEFWLLETPLASNSGYVWYVDESARFVSRNSAIHTYGVRPAIEVDKTKIAY